MPRLNDPDFLACWLDPTTEYGTLSTGTTGWDGGPDIPDDFKDTFCCSALREVQEAAQLDDGSDPVVLEAVEEAIDENNLEDDDSDHEASPQPRLIFEGESTEVSRKDRKALDKEISWRDLVRLPKPQLAEYIKAAQKEHTSWCKYGPVRAVPDTEAKRILRDPRLRRRILRSRALYRNKNAHKPDADLKAKCRVVVAGFSDPDLASIERYSPTATRLAMHIVLQLCANGWNDPGGPWSLVTGDVEVAFLQGKQTDRQQPLYMLPPSDPILQAAEAFIGVLLFEITGNVYGLANAPYQFSLEVRGRMLVLKFRTHSLDSMFFFYFGPGPSGKWQLEAACLWHVDDMLLTHSPRYRVQDLKDAFMWGSWETSPEPLEYRGAQIQQRADGSILVNQSNYIRTIECRRIRVPPGRTDLSLQPGERSDYRSAGGSLQWVAGSTRIDVAAPTSLLAKGDPQVDDLREMYNTIQHLHDHPDIGLLFQPLDPEKMILVAYGDSSWANAEAFKSQHGLLVVATETTAFQRPTRASPWDWRSHRSRRVVRSTLAAESSAADASTDHGVFASAFWSEVVTGIPATKREHSVVPLYNCTDCRSLWDAVKQLTPSLEEKRTIIDIASIREALRTATAKLLWIPTDQMLADGLTKISHDLRSQLAAWMERPMVVLKEPLTQDV